MQYVQEYPDMESTVTRRIMDMNLFHQVNDLANQLRPVAVALDKAQSDKTGLADACDIFYCLLAEPVLQPHKDAMMKRFNQAITPYHRTAYMLHPKYDGLQMTLDQVEMAKCWLMEKSDEYVAVAASFQAEAAPYPPSFFSPACRLMHPAIWWKAVGNSANFPEGFVDLMITLKPATTSSAAIERVFTSFGLVMSNLRNRLGLVKAQKLVFCYLMLRGPQDLEY